VSAPQEKPELELQKLRLEIRTLQRPFRSNPAHLISALTALLAVAALFFSVRFSQNEYVLAETKSAQAKIETEKAEETTKHLTDDKRKLEEDIAAKVKRRDELEALLHNADSLLSRAQATADSKLRSDIDKLRETTKPSSPFWSSLPEVVNQPSLREAANVDRVLREANDQITNARGRIQAKELSGFQNSQTGYNANIKNKRVENQLAFMKPGYQQPKSYTKYVVQMIGNELQFSFWDGNKETVFYRTPVDRPMYNQDFEEAIKRSVEPQLKVELDRSD
jgi:hypothetical protein